jgi:hypothetical protein
MWCTQCHTAFSWRTGTIQNVIHNPHYYEWLRRTNNDEIPRNENMINCQRVLNHNVYTIAMRHLNRQMNSPNFAACRNRLHNTIRNTIHLVAVVMPEQTNYENKNQDLRVKYLMNEISETRFKELVQRNDKKQHKNQEIRNIYEIVENTVTDILYRFLDYLQTAEVNGFEMTILDEINEIVNYANECLLDVSNTYTCTRVWLDKYIRLHRSDNVDIENVV